jgi:hypothetical protein
VKILVTAIISHGSGTFLTSQDRFPIATCQGTKLFYGLVSYMLVRYCLCIFGHGVVGFVTSHWVMGERGFQPRKLPIGSARWI